jgi:hypothetical protein
VKRATVTDTWEPLFFTVTGSAYTFFGFSSQKLYLQQYDGSSSTLEALTTSVYRDPSAWYHVQIAVDTTQATGSNRLKLYINGVQVTALDIANYGSQNLDTYINATNAHYIGVWSTYSHYFDGYLADIYFIDGQALTPSSFTETDATTGQLIPKAFSGSYGSQGWHLEFADNSSNTATTLGKDTSGNGNNWTPNNLSVTAGAGNDSLVDVPTNGAQTDTGVGGEVRGNYCTWNPLSQSGSNTLSNGNLDVVIAASSTAVAVGTIGVSSGKWYWEVVATAMTTAGAMIGVADLSAAADNRGYPSPNGWYYYANSGQKYNNNTGASYGATYAVNDVIGIALDMDAGTLTFYKNGATQGVAYSTGISGKTISPALNNGTGGGTQTYIANFGQRPFAYTAPSGFKALCTANLPAPLVTKPNTVFDAITYTGNGSSQSITTDFSPDFVWLKSRSNGTYSHYLFDIVRGNTQILSSNSTGAESPSSTSLTSFNSTGFTVGSDVGTNSNGMPFIAWTWDAGSSTVTNTQGSITSSVRANATAGFSIVTYTGNGTNNATVGHGLGVAPRFLIGMDRTGGNWQVWGANMNNGSFDCIMNLNTTDALATGITTRFRAASSTTFTIGTDGDINANGNTYVTYCFAPVVGYSSFGSYTGNGSSDGPFVYTGFRPAFVMLKESSASGNGWEIRDSMREPYNDSNRTILLPNLSNAEITDAFPIDFTSSGFKVRNTGGGSNNSGATYIYAAFAESPFNYARAR